MARKNISLPLTGKCQCGEISYRITQAPLTLYACHCSECQKQSSSAFGMSMPVPLTGFELKGAPRYWQRLADDGNSVECAFCRSCGTRIFHRPARNPDIVNIKPGTLDNTNWIKPVGHLWTDSAQRGSHLPRPALLYARQPVSFEPLFEAFRLEYEFIPDE